jgi:YidC/Oxa1 family membrane protein insertase
MKVMNPEWRKIDIEPMELWMRDMIGESLDVDKIEQIAEVVQRLLNSGGKYRSVIEGLLEEYMYNVGHTAEVGGRYIVDRIEQKRGSNSGAEIFFD